APGALAPKKLREGRVTTGTGGYTPAFPARWFTAYFVLSPVNQRLPPSPARCVSIAADLAPAWARQDHTTSPSALRAARLSAHPRPPQPASRVVTIAIRPSAIEAGCADNTSNPNFWKVKNFHIQGLTGICGSQPRRAN